MEVFLALLTALTLTAQGPLLSVAAVDTSGGSGQEAQVVSDTVAIWEANLGARRACSAGVTVVFEDLSSRRGEYRPGSRTVAIDVGRPLSVLPATVGHELAHHTFLACGAFADASLTEAFYAAQGLPLSRGWFDYGDGWAATPAEHFAETMAVVTTGRSEGGIRVTAAARAVVAAWLAGAALPAVSPPPAAPLPDRTAEAPARDEPAREEPEMHRAGPPATPPRAPILTLDDVGTRLVSTYYVD